MVTFPSYIPIGLTRSTNWQRSQTFARWIVEHHEQLKFDFDTFKREERTEGITFEQFAQHLFKTDRGIYEPFLN